MSSAFCLANSALNEATLSVTDAAAEVSTEACRDQGSADADAQGSTAGSGSSAKSAGKSRGPVSVAVDRAGAAAKAGAGAGQHLWNPLALLELVGVKLEVEDTAGSIQGPDAPVRCLDPALVVELVELLLALLK